MSVCATEVEDGRQELVVCVSYSALQLVGFFTLATYTYETKMKNHFTTKIGQVNDGTQKSPTDSKSEHKI